MQSGSVPQPRPKCLHSGPQTMLLEKLRVTKRPANEATFNVFYYLLAGMDNALR